MTFKLYVVDYLFMDFSQVWWVEALLGIVVLVGVQYGLALLLARIEKHHLKGWKGQVGKIFRRPLTFFLWAIGALYLIDIVGDHLGFSIAMKYLDALRKTVVISCCTWVFYRWKNEVEHTFDTPVQKSRSHDSADAQSSSSGSCCHSNWPHYPTNFWSEHSAIACVWKYWSCFPRVCRKRCYGQLL